MVCPTKWGSHRLAPNTLFIWDSILFYITEQVASFAILDTLVDNPDSNPTIHEVDLKILGIIVIHSSILFHHSISLVLNSSSLPVSRQVLGGYIVKILC